MCVNVSGAALCAVLFVLYGGKSDTYILCTLLAVAGLEGRKELGNWGRDERQAVTCGRWQL